MTLFDNEKIVSSESRRDKDDVQPAKSEQTVEALDEDIEFVKEKSDKNVELEMKDLDDTSKPEKKAFDVVPQANKEDSNDASSSSAGVGDNVLNPEREAVTKA